MCRERDRALYIYIYIYIYACCRRGMLAKKWRLKRGIRSPTGIWIPPGAVSRLFLRAFKLGWGCAKIVSPSSPWGLQKGFLALYWKTETLKFRQIRLKRSVFGLFRLLSWKIWHEKRGGSSYNFGAAPSRVQSGLPLLAKPLVLQAKTKTCFSGPLGALFFFPAFGHSAAWPATQNSEMPCFVG